MNSLAPFRAFRALVVLGGAVLALGSASSPLCAQPGPPGPPSPTPGRVLLFPEPNFRGEPLIVEAGSAIDNLEYARDRRGHRWNDRISSVRIEGPVALTIFDDANYRGLQATLTHDTADLAALARGDRRGLSWDQRISSLRVEPLQADAPAPFRWERRDAERAVRSAYRDLLGREPDERAVREYRDRLIDRGWSEEQLRDQLRHSPEFRSRDLSGIIRLGYRDLLGREADPDGMARYTRAMREGMSEAEFRADLRRGREFVERSVREAVFSLYRDVLRRDPDPAGLKHYTDLMIDRGWDENRVRDALRHSDEYRRLPGGERYRAEGLIPRC